MASASSASSSSADPAGLGSHYDAVADAYESAWFYQDGTDYQRWLCAGLAERLQATPESRVVDLGAGTGNFSVAMHRLCGLRQKVLCVDPYESLLLQAAAHPEAETLLADGLAFVRRTDQAYDRLLLKEVVHHFDQADLPELFGQAFRQLRPGGRLVIMTRPHDSSHYPFFAGAHQAWSAAQLPETTYSAALGTAGFDVTLDHADYRVEMPAGQWLSMVKGRFWSNFNGFSDAEMTAGLREIRAKLGVGEAAEDAARPISFPDRIVFITGVKRA